MAKSLKIVHVQWIDANATCAWTEVSEIGRSSELTHTVGFLIEETDQMLIVAATYDPSTNAINAYMHIPQVCVKECRKLCQIRI